MNATGDTFSLMTSFFARDEQNIQELLKELTATPSNAKVGLLTFATLLADCYVFVGERTGHSPQRLWAATCIELAAAAPSGRAT